MLGNCLLWGSCVDVCIVGFDNHSCRLVEVKVHEAIDLAFYVRPVY